MVLERGEKIHVITRRGFENDIRRHFIGEVFEVDGVLARIEGYAFVFDAGKIQYIRQPDKRTRILALDDCGNIINILSNDADIERAKYIQSQQNLLIVTDGKTFSLNINEFGTTR